MKSKLVKGLCVAALGLLVGTGAGAEEKPLNILAWAGVFPPEMLADFTAKTGFQTRYDNYDSDEILETRLLSGTTGYDFVVPSATPFLQREIAAGAMAKLDKSKIPNFAKQAPQLLELLRVADPTLEYSAIGAWGTTGIGMNVAEVSKRLPGVDLNSYDIIFKPENAAKLQDCGIAFVDSATDVVPIALNYIGLKPDTQSPDDLAKAMEMLGKIRPFITFGTPRTPTDLATGEVCLVLGWSGDMVLAKSRAKGANNGIDIRYVIPKEGTLAWITALAIPANPPNPDAGNAFINYLLETDVAAKLSIATGFANAVTESRKLLPPDLANDESMFPPLSVMAKLFIVQSAKDTLARERTRAWSTFRTGE